SRLVLECTAAAALWRSEAGSCSQCTTSKSWGFSTNPFDLRFLGDSHRTQAEAVFSTTLVTRRRDASTVYGIRAAVDLLLHGRPPRRVSSGHRQSAGRSP